MTDTNNSAFFEGFTIEAQGDLFAIATRYKYARAKISRRGKVLTFSKKSRNRFMKKVARLDHQRHLPIFITLTYPAIYPNPRTAIRHMQIFVKRLRRIAPQCAGVWRIEFQARGAPHFHLLFWVLPFIPKEKIQQMWGEIIGYERPFTRIEAVKSRRGVMFYMSKYLAKVRQTDNYVDQTALLVFLLLGGKALARLGGFISVPYLTGFRRWGVINKAGLPWAVRQIMHVIGKPDAALWNVRRYARKIWRGTNKARAPAGFTLFTVSSYRLFYAYVAFHRDT